MNQVKWYIMSTRQEHVYNSAYLVLSTCCCIWIALSLHQFWLAVFANHLLHALCNHPACIMQAAANVVEIYHTMLTYLRLRASQQQTKEIKRWSGVSQHNMLQ